MLSDDKKIVFINDLINQVMSDVIVALNAVDMEPIDKDLAMISIATSISASCCATVGGRQGAENARAGTCAALGTLVRGIGEALAHHDGSVGFAAWDTRQVGWEAADGEDRAD